MRSKILRYWTVLEISGEARSTLYNKIAAGLWTRPVRIGSRAVGWPDHEVEAIITARIAGKSDTEIRELVRQLESERVRAA